MIQLTSNISQVLARLRRWEAGLPGAIAGALSPETWTEPLRQVARKTLQVQLAQWSGEVSVGEDAAAEVMALVDNFVDSVRGEWAANAASFTAIWDGASVNMKRVLANQELLISTGQYALDLAQENVDAARQAVSDWVANEKNLSEQDDWDVDKANDRVQSILGLIPPPNPAAAAGWAESEKRQSAAQRLAKAIQEWLDRTNPNQRFLTAGVVRQWLEAVMVAWREYTRLHLRDRVEAELNKLTRGTAA